MRSEQKAEAGQQHGGAGSRQDENNAGLCLAH